MDVLIPDQTILIQMAIFVVVYVVLKRVLFDPYLELLEERDEATVGAEAALDDLDAKVLKLEEEITQGVHSARREATRKREEIIAEAESQAEKTVASAKQEADEKLRAARSDLETTRAEIVDEIKQEVDALVKQISEQLVGKAA